MSSHPKIISCHPRYLEVDFLSRIRNGEFRLRNRRGHHSTPQYVLFCRNVVGTTDVVQSIEKAARQNRSYKSTCRQMPARFHDKLPSDTRLSNQNNFPLLPSNKKGYLYYTEMFTRK